jgi:hypothetical protein
VTPLPAVPVAAAEPHSQAPIQVILIVLLVGGPLVYFARLRSKLLDRLLVLVAAALGVAMVAAPGLTTAAAHAAGVSRGVDLVIYLSLLGFGFLAMLFVSKLREAEQRHTELARAIAIQFAHRPVRDGPGADRRTREGSVPVRDGF